MVLLPPDYNSVPIARTLYVPVGATIILTITPNTFGPWIWYVPNANAYSQYACCAAIYEAI
jgi:hypothetical protein